MRRQFGALPLGCLPVIAGMLIHVVSAWATSSSCPTGSVTNNVGANTAPVASSTNDNLTAINGLANGMSSGGATISTTGCGLINQTFGNFNMTNFTGATPASTYTFMGTSNTGVAEALTISTVAQSSGGDNSNAFVTAFSASTVETLTTDFEYLTQLGTGTHPVGNASVQFLEITLNGIQMTNDSDTGSAATTGNFIMVSVNVCENPTVAPGADFSSSCPTGTHLTTLTSKIVDTGANFTAQDETVSFALPSNVPVLAIDTSIELSAAISQTTSFGSVEESFDSPEPPTFVLLGTALGIGFLRSRWGKILLSRSSVNISGVTHV
jgi:hypothetical protein